MTNGTFLEKHPDNDERMLFILKTFSIPNIFFLQIFNIVHSIHTSQDMVLIS